MIKTGLTGFTAALALAALAPAHAQGKAPAAQIAIVDVQKVRSQSRAMAGVRKALGALRKKYETQLGTSEKEMQAEFDRLRKDKDLSRSEYERRVRTLQADVVKLRRQARARSDALNEAFQKSFVKFRQEVILVVKAMAVEEGFTLILNKATLIHASPQYDITDKVVARLNKRLPKLALDYRDPVGGAAGAVTKRRAKAQQKKK
ncbi:MAG: OmpH family outer membrane protein [Rhodospirillaceae bacterium]|nr:OmpH family outer membrane protein [Rhodospirillaceae bacterium]